MKHKGIKNKLSQLIYSPSEWRIFKKLLVHLKNYSTATIGIIILGCLAAFSEGIGISLFIPLMYSIDAKEFSPESDDWLGLQLNALFEGFPASERLLWISVVILILIFFKVTLTYFNGLIYAWLDAKLCHNICSRSFSQILYSNKFSKHRESSGTLVNLLENESYTVGEAVGLTILILTKLLMILIMIGFLLVISWKLTLVSLIFFASISFFTRLITKKVEKISGENLRANESFTQRVLDLSQGMFTIKIYGREKDVQKRFESVTWRLGKLSIKIEAISGIVDPLSEIVISILIIGMLFFALNTSASVSTVLVFVFILYRLRPHIAELDEMRAMVLSASASVSAITNLLELPPASKEMAGAQSFKKLKESIRFKDVSFRYNDEDSYAIQKLALTIPRGITTAIVGTSGSGKTTLLKILIRYFDPHTGQVMIDGVPLAQIELHSWRKKIAFAGQEDFIFYGSIFENISYGHADASEVQVQEAAKQAQADDFIRELPEGYQTIIGNQGMRLSAGQRQRITLARALLRQPEILILDEATNALDSIAEAQILGNLRKFLPACTIINVAHRLSSFKHADHIVVMDNGKVVEEGILDNLIERKALFTQLYNLQLSKVE